MRSFKAHKRQGRGHTPVFDFSRQSVAVNHYYSTSEALSDRILSEESDRFQKCSTCRRNRCSARLLVGTCTIRYAVGYADLGRSKLRDRQVRCSFSRSKISVLSIDSHNKRGRPPLAVTIDDAPLS